MQKNRLNGFNKFVEAKKMDKMGIQKKFHPFNT